MDLNEVLVFTQVVRAGSFTLAAKQLGMQKSSVSRRVAELEARLGTRLLQRTTRKLSLTEEGRYYFERCARAVAELEEAERSLGGMRAAPRGVLKVTAPLSFGFIGPGVAEFLEKNPEVQLEVTCTDRVVDVVEEGFDLAVRAGPLADSALIARRVGGIPRQLVASPRYLERHGTPKHPEELSQHACIAFGPRLQTSWRLVSGEAELEVKISARLAVNDYDIVREAASAGVGIALLPPYSCESELERRQLRHILPGWESAETPIHAVYPSARHLSSKVKGFVDVLQGKLRP